MKALSSALTSSDDMEDDRKSEKKKSENGDNLRVLGEEMKDRVRKGKI